MHNWAYMQSMRSLAIVALILLGMAFALQPLHASSSGLNNIPTADTAPNLTLVVQEYSTYGAQRRPDHIAGFKFGIDPWEREHGAIASKGESTAVLRPGTEVQRSCR